jgi:hypothetical protein
LIYVPEHLRIEVRNVLPKNHIGFEKKEAYNPTTSTLAGDTVTSHSNARLTFACAQPNKPNSASGPARTLPPRSLSVHRLRHEPARDTQHLRRRWTLPCR